MPAADPTPPRADPLAFGDYLLDLAEARLLKGSTPVPLVGRPLQVLDVLARRAGRLVPKDEVLDAVWGHRHVTESVLKVALNAVRAALQDDARSPRYVETVPRRGYRFIAPVRPLSRGEAQAPADARREAAPADAVAPAGRPVGNLPPRRAGLVGRQPDREQLLHLLGHHRVVTLIGLGGMGKTRLALDVAAEQAPADGAWWVALDALPAAAADGEAARAALVAELSATLPVPPSAADGTALLARALRAQSLRLVLDNAEHVVEPLRAVLRELLQAAPGLQVLVTSQRPLRLDEEQLMPLAPLALAAPPADDEPAASASASAPDPATYASGRLLCDRVARARPGWQPAAAEHAAIAAICRTLEGVPLALELAAARVPLLGVEGVRERLAQPAGVLTRSAGDAPARHRSLTATLEWTFRLLETRESAALEQLAIFVRGFDVESAEHVLRALVGDAALDVVQDLQDRSLIVAESSACGVRLRLYDSVRQHALAALSARDGGAAAHAARLRHLQWAQVRALALEQREFHTPQLQWLPQARADIDDLRAALHVGLEAASPGVARELAADTAIALAMVWARLGRVNEGLDWLGRLRDAPSSDGPVPRAAELDRAWGTLAMYAQHVDARRGLEALRAARDALGDGGPVERAYLARHAQGVLHLRLGQRAEHDAALQAQRALQPQDWGVLEQRWGRWRDLLALRDAGRLAEHAAGCRVLADELVAAGAHAESWVFRHALGQALFVMGELDEACTVLRDVVADIAAARGLAEHATVVAMAAAVHLRRGADAEATALARQAIRLLQAQDSVWWMADALPWLAWHQGRRLQALQLQAWADALVVSRGDRRGPVFSALREQFGHVSAGVRAPEARGLSEAEAVGLAFGD